MDGCAVDEVNLEVGFVVAHDEPGPVKVRRQVFEERPGDVLRHAVGRGDVPAGESLGVGERGFDEQVAEQVRLARASARGDGLESVRVLLHGELPRQELVGKADDGLNRLHRPCPCPLASRR